MTEIPSAALAARQGYAEGQSLTALRARTGFSTWQLYHWIDGGACRRRTACSLLNA